MSCTAMAIDRSTFGWKKNQPYSFKHLMTYWPFLALEWTIKIALNSLPNFFLKWPEWFAQMLLGDSRAYYKVSCRRHGRTDCGAEKGHTEFSLLCYACLHA